MHLKMKDELERGPLYDGAIIEHHFTRYMRDYDVIVDVPAAAPDGRTSFIAARYLYRFTHCVEAHILTNISDSVWRDSWRDVYIDCEAWKHAGEPPGYVWGMGWSSAYPGAEYVEESKLAEAWSKRLSQAMHEVRISTDSYLLTLIFYDLIVRDITNRDAPRTELPLG